MFILQKSNKKVSSRTQIAIDGVREGILILPGGQYRAILKTSSINFELMSEAEQDALIDTYQSFLNSLACPLQIVVRIREMDVDSYLESFQSFRAAETEEIYQQQVQNYTSFVRSLIAHNKILSRSFYVIVPYHQKNRDFDIAKEQLSVYTEIVHKGLSRLGMQSRQLSSLEILDLFYTFYSPAQAKRQPISNQTLELLQKAYL